MSQVAGVLFCFASGAQAQLPGTVSAYDDAYKSNISKDGGIKSCIGAPKKYKEAFSDFKKKFKITINRPNNIEAPEGERQVYGLLKSLEGNPMTEKYLKGLKISFVDTLENKKSNCGTAGVYKGGGVIHIPRYEPDVCKKDQSAPRKKIPFSISTLAHEVGHHVGSHWGHKHHHHNHDSILTAVGRGKNYKHYDGPENKFIVRSGKQVAKNQSRTDAKCKPSEYSYKDKKDREELVNENFAEVFAGYWLHPEKALKSKSSCNSQVAQMRAVFQAKRSPCAKDPDVIEDGMDPNGVLNQASYDTGLKVGQ